MPLSPGTTLGAFEILEAIGAGGMGEVYKARDTRLDRVVAIKVLPSHLSESRERRQRFEQEARAIAKLNHPNICTLHDIGHDDGVDFLVMELLEGESLADRLSKGPLPLEQARRYAVQIADALGKAHREGIVHRDLKPGNIFITKPGAKLLDFGLAKFQERGAPDESSESSSLPTQQKPLTADGAILGTFQYMAPEQLEGKDPDTRTDLFAFGAVLYEMLTGKKAFEGKSQASLISAIMSSEPPAPSTLQPVTPARLDDVVSRCLAKDPDERWQSATDLAWELERASDDAPVAADTGKRTLLPWLVAAATVVVAAVVALGPRDTDAPRQAVRTSILAPPGTLRAFGAGHALSPDGRMLVFSVIDSDGKQTLWLRHLDELASKPLERTDGARYPFWSPDGKQIGFFTGRVLKRVPASGGPPQTIGEAVGGLGISGTWNRDDTILFGSVSAPVFKVRATGGEAEALTELDASKAELGHSGPMFLPDGRHFIYTAYSTTRETGGTYVTSLDEPEERRFLLPENRGSIQATFAELGYLLFRREEALYAQAFDPFDIDALTLRHQPVAIAPFVATPDAWPSLSVARADSLVYDGNLIRFSRLVWRDRTGARLEQVGPDAVYFTFSLSGDGQRVMVTSDDLLQHVYQTGRAGPVRFGSDAYEFSSVWSPDDRLVAYTRGFSEIIVQPVGGGPEESHLLPEVALARPSDWTPGGRSLILNVVPSTIGASWDIWRYSPSERKAEPLLETEYNEYMGVVSPDGQWLAYMSDDVGEPNVYVKPHRESGAPIRISPDGGLHPEWRQDGRELFYLAPNGTVMAISWTSDFDAVDPVELFRFPRIGFDTPSFHVAGDGTRFLVLEKIGETPPLTLVQNWTAELQ